MHYFTMPRSGAVLGLCLFSNLAHAATLDGSQLAPWLALPFAGILLSIALFPLFAANFWHHHFGKIAAFWTILFMVPFAMRSGINTVFYASTHTLLLEYAPFLILISSLYIVSGGIYVRGNLHGSPVLNTGLLALGTVLASVMGTTGASILLIRPLLRANDNRKHRKHIVIFFIFLVANVGGSLTPIGDPPLFLGFLKGVSFYWTFSHMLTPMLVTSIILLALFYAFDRYYFVREDEMMPTDPTPDTSLGIEGKRNIVFIFMIVALVLLSGIWETDTDVSILGQHIKLPALVRDIGLLVVALVSWFYTPQSIHEANHYSWFPVKEVGLLFLGIFLTMIPVLAMLQAGDKGPFAALIALTSQADNTPNNVVYFWLTGILSSFLDNAPTYLVFFNLAGGDAQYLMNIATNTLLAISCGAVFMGANTYIGNAPNFMVRSIAESRGVDMPSFFGYMVWSTGILIPIYFLVGLIFFTH